MPFGPDCEYPDFAACVRQNEDKANPEAYCGTIQKATEGRCANKNLTGAAVGLMDLAMRLPHGRRAGYRIENRAGEGEKPAMIYIYDEISPFGVNASNFVGDLAGVEAGSIELHINSPGGSVFDGVAIYQALKDHPATVNVVVDSLAASAASFIAMAGDSVAVARNGQFMVHKAQGFAAGDDDTLMQLADILRRQNENIADIYAQRTGGDKDAWLDLMKAETWFNADEAKAVGLADEIRGGDKDEDEPDETQNSFDLSMFNFAGRTKAPAPAIQKATGAGPKYDYDELIAALGSLKGR